MGEVGPTPEGKWRYASPSPTPGKVCKEAGEDRAHRARPAPHPGPRCATCHRAVKKTRKRAAHETRTRRTYSITPEEYQALYEAQGGRCALCRRATGASKALAVDHDHSCTEGHPVKQGCRKCVRGLLCSTCNRIIGHFRDDPDAFLRGNWYLTRPPARGVLGV
jgi:recombination endonuclease VII